MTTILHETFRVLRCAGVAATALCACANCFAAQISVAVKDQGGQPVAEVVVYANIIVGVAPARAKRELSVEQINKEFVPLISVLQTGTLVNFPNRDAVRHHVYSFSPAKTFEIKLYSGVPGKPILFDKPGEVVLGCNIHDTMLAHILVVDTPIFGKTDKRGVLLLDGLSAGEYEVHIWFPGLAPAASVAPQKIKLSATQAATLAFTLSLKPASPSAPKPKTGNEIY